MHSLGPSFVLSVAVSFLTFIVPSTYLWFIGSFFVAFCFVLSLFCVFFHRLVCWFFGRSKGARFLVAANLLGLLDPEESIGTFRNVGSYLPIDKT